LDEAKRWAIRDAGIATFYALRDITGGALTGEPIVTLPSLKTSGVETTGETVYARGGRGNAKLVGFSSNREATLSLEDALFDNDAMSMLTGNDIVEGVKEVEISEVITASVIDTITVTKGTPLVTGTLAVYEYVDGMKDGANLATAVAGSDITAAGVAADTVYVAYYTVETDANASTVKVTSDKFGGTFKIVIDLLVTDSITKQNFAGQLIIPNAKFEDNFSLDLAADGDPAVLNLTMEVLKDPASTDMWELVIFDETAIV
jgi:hypothetical protein